MELSQIEALSEIGSVAKAVDLNLFVFEVTLT